MKESKGLTTLQAQELQKQFGKNELTVQKRETFFHKLLHIICEPMFLLLIVAAVIYFLLGEPRDGAIMLVFVIGIIAIDAIQEWKTDKTLHALKDLSAPHVTVQRDGVQSEIASVDLVPGDLMLLSEGVKIPADGFIQKCNDFCVDESSLTGEAEGVFKHVYDADAHTDDYWRKDYCYAGTLVTQGSAAVVVDRIGKQTEYGKIGANVASAPDTPTPLQRQTGSLVKLSAGIAAVLFALVGIITYFNLAEVAFQSRITSSILSGITLAMAMIPEEFPVILTVFLSMGAWRLAKKQSLVRRLPAVETLGAVSVLCVDKTGTITMNQMQVQEVYTAQGSEEHLLETMGLACETDAYDPMEKAMLSYCEEHGISRKHLFGGKLLSEYAFTNELKMMGHVWQHDDEYVVAAKGSSENLIDLCILTDENRAQAQERIDAMSRKGLRVIAIAEMHFQNETDFPALITQCRMTLLGLIGLADPPRASVKADIAQCIQAGIRVVMITGDNGVTASSIAQQIGMPHSSHIITGAQLSEMTDEELREKVRDVSIFSRVIPEHKMRIVRAFKENGEVVAMTGDGVNDAPALKYADIGIAMGKRGSEVSREASDLILMDDNFTTIVDTVRDGRRIYDNIRKAVGYVFTIHIPIALASLLAPLLGVMPELLMLLPLHVVLLELVIDPTCSIVLERQPAEADLMTHPPRNPKEKLLPARALLKSIVQGLAVFAVSFGTYYYILQQSGDAALARSMGITIVMLCNLLLVQVNSSHRDFMVQSMRKLAKDKVMWIIMIATIAGILVILYTPLAGVLKLEPLSFAQFLFCVGLALIGVLWYEIVKLVLFLRQKSRR